MTDNRSARVSIRTPSTNELSFGPFLVSEYGEFVYEDKQFNLHDAAHRSLEWVPSVPRTHVARIPAQLLGFNQ